MSGESTSQDLNPGKSYKVAKISKLSSEKEDSSLKETLDVVKMNEAMGDEMKTAIESFGDAFKDMLDGENYALKCMDRLLKQSLQLEAAVLEERLKLVKQSLHSTD